MAAALALELEPVAAAAAEAAAAALLRMEATPARAEVLVAVLGGEAALDVSCARAFAAVAAMAGVMAGGAAAAAAAAVPPAPAPAPAAAAAAAAAVTVVARLFATLAARALCSVDTVEAVAEDRGVAVLAPASEVVRRLAASTAEFRLAEALATVAAVEPVPLPVPLPLPLPLLPPAAVELSSELAREAMDVVDTGRGAKAAITAHATPLAPLLSTTCTLRSTGSGACEVDGREKLPKDVRLAAPVAAEDTCPGSTGAKGVLPARVLCRLASTPQPCALRAPPAAGVRVARFKGKVGACGARAALARLPPTLN